VRVERVDAATADALTETWRARRPIVVELGPEAERAIGDPAAPPTTTIAGRQPWELTPELDLVADRAHHALWANTADARGRDREPHHAWTAAAVALGARAAADAPGIDVVLPDGSGAVCDGGPLDIDLPARTGTAVVHRIALEHGACTPLGANRTDAQLAPDQLEAVLHPSGASRVIAPAGSGKTRVLTERARTLIGAWGLPPAAVAVVAFNRRAADELRARTTDVPGLRIRTLNALGLRLLADGVRTIEEPAARQHLAALVKLPRRAEADPAAPWLEALSRVRLGLAEPAAVEAELPDVAGLDAIARGYRERLGQAHEADFDEQVVGAVDRLLADGQLRLRAQRFARVLLVDELQDLTPAHILLVRLLAGPAGSVFGVGDDDQTIYGYAGASPRWLVDFSTFFPGAGEHALEVNYRCPAPVVAAAANLLTRNALRVPKQMRPGPAASAEGLEVVDGGDAPAAATAARVRELVTAGAAPGDVAVLARVNAALAPVQVLLRHHGIPVTGGVDERFLQRGGVRAALAWLRVASAGTGRIPGPALRDAARRPKRGMRDSLLDLVARQRDEAGLAQLSSWLDGKGSDREAAKVLDLAGDVATVRTAAAGGTTAGVLDVVRNRIGAGGLDESAVALDSWSRGAIASHGDDLDALASLAALEPDPSRFAAWLAAALAAPDDAGGVVLASIHAVKGQEWPHVVLHHATAGTIPHRLAIDVEEERRTFHVAITRGRDSVTVVTGSPPSPFVAEMAAPGEPPPARAPASPPRTAGGGRGGAELVALAPGVSEALAADAFERLRAWRAERAAGKPAYTVFADRTLREIAARLPTTEVALRSITGVGPAKLDAYGDELLALCADLRPAT
jgi:DNA helicase-2/ATP-dependent DNA helicase PcrA